MGCSASITKNEKHVSLCLFPSWCIIDPKIEYLDVVNVMHSWMDSVSDNKEDSFVIIHKQISNLFLEIHPTGACMVDLTVFQTIISILVNHMASGKQKLKMLMTTFANDNIHIKHEWYSTFGLCFIAVLRKSCDKWNDKVELSWVKCYSVLMKIMFLKIKKADIKLYDTAQDALTSRPSS